MVSFKRDLVIVFFPNKQTEDDAHGHTKERYHPEAGLNA